MQDRTALPGPSNIEPYLQPQGPPPPPAHLASTQDLIARFQLLGAYDKYVRPYINDASADTYQPPQTPHSPPTDKGKGKEREVVPEPAAQTPGGGDAQDGEDDDGPGGKGDKKKKNNYRHLIKGIAGKHSMKKDDYLTTMMQVPPKQRITIVPFDQRTQREAFAVSPEGLKGWNPSALVLESAQAREDRKKRKELKKLQKAQTTVSSLGTTTWPPQTHPQSTASSSLPPTTTSTSTPKTQPPINMPTPASVPAQAPTPLPKVPPIQPPTNGYPVSGKTPTSAHPLPRGKKRERGRDRDDGVVVNGVPPTPAGKFAVPPGANALVVRPTKKPRMDTQGQSRDLSTPVQQPTPQGV